MRVFVSFFLVTLLTLLAGNALAAPEPAPQSPGHVGGTTQLPVKAPQSAQAAFTQEKHLKILAYPVMARGFLAYQAPKSLRWEYLYPVRSLFLMHDGKIKKFVEQDSEFIPDPGMTQSVMFPGFEEITNWLAGHFDNNPALEATFSDEHTLVLTPTSPQLAAMITKIELRLGKTSGFIESIVISEGKEDRTILNFSDAELDQPLPEQLFTKP